jgi:hypothetical protein
MKETKLTLFRKSISTLCMVVMMMLTHSSLTGQCSLACTSNVQVSLDEEDCEAVVLPRMVVNVPLVSCPNAELEVEVKLNGVVISNDLLTTSHIGKKLEVKVTDTNSGNSCWGYLTVEDKIAPVINCVSPADIYCFQESTYKGPTATENCTDYTLAVISENIITNNCANNLPDSVMRKITRTYVATDKSGNKSEPCTVMFNVKGLTTLAGITGPGNFLAPSNNLSCNGTYKKDENMHPHPDVTGVPQIGSVKLWPNPYLACNIVVDYSDQPVTIGCTTKIIRTWKILEWSCRNRPEVQLTQMIEITDSEGPSIAAIPDIKASTTPHTCEAVVNLPAATVKDNCSTATEIKVSISGGSKLLNTNGGVNTFPIGEHQVIYSATDKCGNVTTRTVNIWVEDNTAPVAICDQNTTVALTTDGTALVHASTFDDGSYDECKLAKMLVKRMVPGCQPCPTPEFPGFTYLGTFEGHYYYASQHTLTPALAQKHAVAMGGYAAVIEKATENTWLGNAVAGLNSEECYTIGLVNDGTGWKWSNGSTASYRNWSVSALPASSSRYACIGNASGWNELASNVQAKYIVEITDPCGFSSYAEFCCSDITTPATSIMVQFRVIDAACNWNDCMVNAQVQDKLPPSITCPADLSVTCEKTFDPNNLGIAFGNATATDNCEVVTPTETKEIKLSSCNIGTIKRTFEVTDRGGKKATCSQVIEFGQVENRFWINEKNHLDPEDDVIWPKDTTVTMCADPSAAAFGPANMGRPKFLDAPCDLVGAEYKDQVFYFNNQSGIACFKILRTWSVIDWCQFVRGQYPIWTYTQTIKSSNLVKPTIIDGCAAKTVTTFDAECKVGSIELTARAYDDCSTQGLKWIAKIDLGNDGSFVDSLQREGLGTVSTQANPTVALASGTYPVGTHRVQWTFEDRCGNITTCDQVFKIINGKAPTPYLINGLAVDLMPVDVNKDGVIDGGMVELWASDFDRGSSHPCGYPVLLSFTSNVNNKSKTYTCADRGNGRTVTIYASIITPQGDTVRSFANTTLSVQDNRNACSRLVTEGRVAVRGKITTETKEGVDNATMILASSEQMIQKTNASGEFSFADMPKNGNYVLSGTKTDDYMNGVSTLDLILMQRHILGVQRLTSPYLLVAADVNADKKINATDLVDLRKLILGTSAKLPNNNSWRFIDKNYTFADPTNAQAEDLKESYTIEGLNKDMNIDFTAVKVGDINATVKANATDNVAQPRSNKVLTLVNEAKSFVKGEEVVLNIAAEEAATLTGMQFSMAYDAATVELVDIKGNDIELANSNLGLQQAERGIVTLSWSTEKAQEVSDVLTLVFKAKENGSTEGLVSFNSAVTTAEAYDANYEIMKIESRTAHTDKGFELYQNSPNPFASSTSVEFKLPEASDVSFKIYDVTGKVLLQTKKYYSAGKHSILVDKSQLGLSGVLYYRLDAGNNSATKKMVVIE